ncbi:MAG: PH domain-containing protein [Planctomycetota bacterium]|nr:PH domain-containing protein [Planctomycetota bacterium]
MKNIDQDSMDRDETLEHQASPSADHATAPDSSDPQVPRDASETPEASDSHDSRVAVESPNSNPSPIASTSLVDQTDEVFAMADGVLRDADPRYIKTESIGWWIATFFVAISGGIPLFVLAWNGVGPTWLRLLLVGIWGTLTLLLVYFSIRYPMWEHRRTKYRVTPKGIEIHKGVVWRQVINVPRNRVQHTDVTQGPILRHYGLAVLTIHTAGTTHSTVTQNGITRETALALRDFLIQREKTLDE